MAWLGPVVRVGRLRRRASVVLEEWSPIPGNGVDRTRLTGPLAFITGDGHRTAVNAAPVSRRHRIAAVAVLAAGALLQGASYWPGIMTWDALNQYGQALAGEYDDWHPPAMAWLWRRLLGLAPGPAPMFLLQVGLYWVGYGLIVAGAFRRGQAVAAGIAVAVALMPFPLALMGSVLKDCLMEGVLLTAAGLLVSGGARWGARVGIWLLLLVAATLRFNAFLAALPLAIAAMPAAWRGSRPRFAVAGVAAAAALLFAMPAANRALGAERSGVEWSLAMFDLAGITAHTGIDQFPAMGVSDPVWVARSCYRPDKWDYFSSWADPLCPITFDRLDPIVTERGLHAYPTLLRATLAHPVAYAAHRLAHFNLNARFLVHDEVQGPVPDRATANEYHFAVPSNPGLRFLNRTTGWSVHSPLGWPIVWIALAAGMAALCPWLPSRGLVAPLAWSGLLYGLGYLPFSVSSELRYHVWTITGTALAAAFAMADLAVGEVVPRRILALALTPALGVALLCTLWRLT